MQLRYATAPSAAGWARVARSARPYLVCSERAVRHDMEHGAALARFVAVEDDEVFGTMRVRRTTGGRLSVAVAVHAGHRGRGVGRLLFDRVLRLAEQVDPGAALTGIVNGDDRSTAVARHWGCALEREHSISSVDPRGVGPGGSAPTGLDVVPLERVGVRAVWECHEAAVPGDPSGLSRSMSLDEYDATQWRGADHRPELGRAVVEDGTVVAFSSVDVDAERAWSSMTGTRPECRGRGLATLAKQHTLNALADAGVTLAWTGNDAANAAMLAVNGRLGYRKAATTWGAVRNPDSSGVARRGTDAKSRTNRG